MLFCTDSTFAALIDYVFISLQSARIAVMSIEFCPLERTVALLTAVDGLRLMMMVLSEQLREKIRAASTFCRFQLRLYLMIMSLDEPTLRG